jgi:hypothetical protein
VGDPEHRVLLRGEGDVHAAPGREDGLTEPGAGPHRRFGLDVFAVPSLLLLLARDLLVRDPPRILAWRLLHDPQLSTLPGGLAAFVPRPHPDVDRDPIALALATAAGLLAALYLLGAVFGRGARFRAGVIALAGFVLVVAPAAGFMAMGCATGRPYGQDGGVVQLPLALDKILAGESPYAADYSNSILGKEARVSKFWSTRGGNPILRHHAYLPGTHLLAMPFHLAGRAAGIPFDPRVMTFAAFILAAYLATRVVAGVEARLCAAALVLVNPLLYWHQIFGANDIVFVAMILATVWLLQRERPLAAAAMLGLACGTKQLAWPFAPFLLLAASGARWPPGPEWKRAARRFVQMTLMAAAVFAIVVLPVAALDFRAFYADIVGYNVGLPGADNYPLGGTPGFGFANFLLYFGHVRALGDYFPFGVFYLLLVPFGLFLIRATLRRGGDVRHALVLGSSALVASLYFSRVVHPNYLIPPAILLPIGALGATLAADVVLVPLLLLMVAVEVSELAPLQRLWEDALTVRLPMHVAEPWASLLPRAGFDLTDDPLTLAWSALAAGLATAYLAGGVLGMPVRWRAVLAVVSLVLVVVVPAGVVAAIGERTGTVRAQDEWVAETRRASDALALDRTTPRPTREAWSASFRHEPPRLLVPARVPAPGGLLAVAAVLRPLGRDPRIVSVVAVLFFAGLVLARGRPVAKPLLLSLLMVPAAATTAAFGGGLVVTAVALVIATAASIPAGIRVRAAACAVAATSSFLGVLALLASPETSVDDRRMRRGIATGITAGIITVMVAALMASVAGGPRGLASLRWLDAGPGVGVANIGTYFGYALGLAGVAVLMLLVVVAVYAVGRAVTSGRVPATIGAATASVLALVLLPSTSPDAVLVPIALLLVAGADAAPD